VPVDRPDWPRLCAAVIPCLNEAGSIGTLVSDVRRHLPTALVVNDGSTDATATAAQQAGAIVLTSPANTGKGRALDRGLRCALASGHRWALTLDGDGQHAPADIPAFFARAEETAASLVVGNRMGRAAAMPWLRRQVNRWMSRRISVLVGQNLPDSQCGFRLIELAAWQRVRVAAAHFEVESETLVAFARAGLRIESVPVQLIYHPGAPSKIQPVRDTWRWLRWWLRARRSAHAAADHPPAVRSGDV